jgi:hypothetical protein
MILAAGTDLAILLRSDFAVHAVGGGIGRHRIIGIGRKNMPTTAIDQHLEHAGGPHNQRVPHSIAFCAIEWGCNAADTSGISN